MGKKKLNDKKLVNVYGGTGNEETNLKSALDEAKKEDKVGLWMKFGSSK